MRRSFTGLRSGFPATEVQSHLFAVGQAVRRKGGFGKPSSHLDIFRITAMLPESLGSLHYRIRTESERHERVATEDDLELVEGVHLGIVLEARKNPLDQIFGSGAGQDGRLRSRA
ncbi:MAG: hypothetical protein O9322_13425 [Beijerinckiaceae bacterium]|nr:hypothetical protein [Beijerinckiaceae bacterium]MCZ8300345.1 hypothetical protein [Beijerinckiaceae bacterium]